MIVINEMKKLPKNCAECPIFDWHYRDCPLGNGHSIHDNTKINVETDKPDWCPLREV